MPDKSSSQNIQESIDNHSAKLEAILNTVIDGIITINAMGLIQSFNPSAERIFGYSQEEVIGKNIKILMPQPYHKEHDGYLHNYHTTGDKKIIGIGREVRAQKKDGEIFPMELGVNEMIISGEKMFVGTIRDISERKKIEKDLKDSQAKIQAIVDNTVDGMITIDEKGHIETFNKACERIFGYAAEEVIGKNIKVLMPQPYQKNHDNYLKNYSITKQKKIIGSGREVEGLRKNGQQFPLDLSVSVVEIQGRKIYSGILRDISERKKAEEDIKRANTELKEFAYRTSHDLRSPLISSIQLLEILKKAVSEDKKKVASESINHIQQSLKNLEKLVKDIFLLTHTKDSREEKESINVVTLINDSLEKCRYIENFNRVEISKKLEFSGTLLVKKNRMAIIIENLLSNAIRYQDLDKTYSYIHILTYIDNKYFVLEISDNGLGIPENQKIHLFKMFKRFHPKVSFGSGLGLYIIKKSAEALEGKIHFEESDEETTFKIYIPLQA